MDKCKLLNIKMPLDLICPASYYGNRFICYKDCGFSPLRKGRKKIKKIAQTNLNNFQ